MGVSTVKTNRDLTFLNSQDFLDGRDQLFFFSVKIFKIKIFQLRLWRIEIFVEIVKICPEILTLSRPFESENDEKSRRIEKSWWENTKIHAFLDRDRDKMSRNAKIFRSRRISQSWWRLFGLDIDVETKSRHTFWRCLGYLDCRDSLFDNVETNRDPQGSII